MFARVRWCSQSRIGAIYEQLRTLTNNLHLTGGQGVTGSNPASPTGCVVYWGGFPPKFPPKLIEHGGPGLFYSRRAIHVQFVFLAYSMNSHSALPLWVLDQTPSDTAQNSSPHFRQLGRAKKSWWPQTTRISVIK